MENTENIIESSKTTKKTNWSVFTPLAEKMMRDQKKWLSKHVHELEVYDMDGNLLTPEEILK